jgi:hypothetical protein
LTQSLEANGYLQVDPSPRQTLEVVLPRSQSRRILVAIDEITIVLPDTHRLLPTFARWHSAVPAVAQGSLEVLVERVEAQVDGMPHNDGLRARGHHHTRPCLSEFAPSATGRSYHQEGVKQHEKHVRLHKDWKFMKSDYKPSRGLL